MSILIQNIKNEADLIVILSSHLMRQLVECEFTLDDEIVDYYVNMLKGLVL
jgi:hypothetical protein